MCGILASNGGLSKGRYQGIAPECSLICGKVLDRKGNGDIKKLLAALEWILELRKQYPIRIVNISIEMNVKQEWNKDEYRDLQQMIERLWQADMITVIAAGNSGPDSMSVSPIGVSPYCICVGCHDDGFVGRDGKSCKSYSARGPAQKVDGLLTSQTLLKKPDIVAPGTQIVSCCHKIIRNGRSYQRAYIDKSGTSMATPIVSGALALCLQKYPDISNEELKRYLLISARDLGENWSIQGAGILNIQKLLEVVGL